MRSSAIAIFKLLLLSNKKISAKTETKTTTPNHIFGLKPRATKMGPPRVINRSSSNILSATEFVLPTFNLYYTNLHACMHACIPRIAQAEEEEEEEENAMNKITAVCTNRQTR